MKRINADRCSTSFVNGLKQIKLETLIKAPVDRCFNLARSIDLHLQSARHTQEKAIAGIRHGLISIGEEVEWQARHFGLTLGMRVRITQFEPPTFFRDQQVHGPFKIFVHDHAFLRNGDSTLMTDQVEFRSPLWLIGVALDVIVIKRHLLKFLVTRNAAIKSAAESDLWQQYLLPQNQ